MTYQSNNTATVLGAGLSGLTAALSLNKYGVEVDVIEKNADIGGRCRQFQEKGFTFDMGPSWYWMPDVFERFFNRFDRSTSDYFKLIKLDPGFRIYFGVNDCIDIPNTLEEQKALFERLETGSGEKLEKFLKESKIKYDIGVSDLVYKPSYSLLEFFSFDIIRKMIKMNALESFHKYIRRSFSHPKILSLLEFPILFLGGTAKNTPSLYSLMNYSCLSQGTYYPMGGFSKITEALGKLCEERGVNIHLNTPISSVQTQKGLATTVNGDSNFESDGIISSMDYHHFDKNVLGSDVSNYSQKYWDEQVLSPSSLLFYIGVKGTISGLIHHNLFFDSDFDQHAKEIYDTKVWPSHPLFYVCCPSKTDDSVAPKGHENLFLLVPIAAGIEDTEQLREEYYNRIMQRLEKNIGQEIVSKVVYKRSYCIKDFESDYNSYKGNAYGLANTLMQTAMFKPKMNHKKIKNLFHCGQLTVPGPGVPPSIISGQVAASQLLSYFNKDSYEKYL